MYRRRNKYNARKVTIDNHKFDSKAEAARYRELKILLQQRLISHLELQPEFVLIEPYTNGAGKKIRGTKYRADFRYIDMKTGETVIEDVKGRKTEVYKIKKKLFEQKYYPQTIVEIRA